jgi:hypothetical protein
VIDAVKRPESFEDAFELAELPQVTACVGGLLDIGAKTEPDLIVLVIDVTGCNVVSSAAKLGNQPGPNRT